MPVSRPGSRGAAAVRVLQLPAQASSYLTLGTPEVNAAATNGSGYVRYVVMTGDPGTTADEADVRLTVEVTDVRRSSDLSDYTGELQYQAVVRVTDRGNGSLATEPATGFDTELAAAVPCTETPSVDTGATCALDTTVDALLPGAVVEKRRATWNLGAAQVYDGGPSERAGGSGARLFETQGLFVP